MAKGNQGIGKVFNRETMLYLLFGVLTTVINIGLCGFMTQVLHWDVVVSNVLGWIVSVLFAFVTNKLLVFRSRQTNWKVVARETLTFFAARILSLGIDTLGMWLWVDICHGNFWIAKVVMNIIVVILNYIFSKWIIFRKKPQTKNEKIY